MFSEAISSISSRWRESSHFTASATSGSVSANDAVNRFATGAWARDASVIAFTHCLSGIRPPAAEVPFGDSIPARERQAMGAAGECCPHLGAEPPFRLAFADGGDGSGAPPQFLDVPTSHPPRALLITTNNNPPHRIWHRPGRSLGSRPRHAGDAISGPRRPPPG